MRSSTVGFAAILLIFNFSFSSSLSSDGLSLLALKAAVTADPFRVFETWSESDSTPCRWRGVSCDPDRRVVAVSLADRSLTGYIPSELGALLLLSSLSLSGNNFSKPIPARLFNATSLLSLDLSRNSLSGEIPSQISSLSSLTHLDLSSNLLNGSLPESLVNLSQLVGTLNLSYNRFSGEVPASYGRFPVMVSLDVRNNNLSGRIPQVGSLLNQGPTAFSGNPNLCGFPLQTPCPEPEAQNPRVQATTPENPRDPVFSPHGFVERERGRNGSVAVPLISGVSVVIGVTFVAVWVMRRQWSSDEGKAGKEKSERGSSSGEDEGQKGKFVVVDDGFGLELEDLLRASAYVVGKSRTGIVYKVVVSGGKGSGLCGKVVAVRRLSDGDATWKFKDFEAEVEAIGKVQHPNIVRLRAFYYASDEKLFIEDFIPNGSLSTALHGAPGNPAPSLSWATRMNIIQGVARGLMHIHDCSPRKHVHGLMKSTKILLDDDHRPYISGFGLSRLFASASRSVNSASKRKNPNLIIVSPKNTPSPSTAYIAPEARPPGSRSTQKCDVYSFGIVLMETLTGRSPDGGPGEDDKGLESLVRKVFMEERPLSEIIDPVLLHEVHAKTQVLAVFHIALNCTEPDPGLRPRMKTICESLDRIQSL